jgi:hypothetical protein
MQLPTGRSRLQSRRRDHQDNLEVSTTLSVWIERVSRSASTSTDRPTVILIGFDDFIALIHDRRGGSASHTMFGCAGQMRGSAS